MVLFSFFSPVRGPLILTDISFLWNFIANGLFCDGIKFVKVNMNIVPSLGFSFYILREIKNFNAVNINEMDNITQQYSHTRFHDMKQKIRQIKLRNQQKLIRLQSNPYTSCIHDN